MSSPTVLRPPTPLSHFGCSSEVPIHHDIFVTSAPYAGLQWSPRAWPQLPSRESHMESWTKSGRAPKILLSGVFGPFGVDDEFGRKENIMELFHNQVTKAQGPASFRFHHRSFGLYFIAANIDADVTVLDFPSRRAFCARGREGRLRHRGDLLHRAELRQGPGDGARRPASKRPTPRSSSAGTVPPSRGSSSSSTATTWSRARASAGCGTTSVRTRKRRSATRRCRAPRG